MSNKWVGDCILGNPNYHPHERPFEHPVGPLKSSIGRISNSSKWPFLGRTYIHTLDVSRRNRGSCLEKGRGAILLRLGDYFCLLCFSFNFSVVAWLVCKGHTVHAHKSLYLSATEEHRAHELCQFYSFSQDIALGKHKKVSVHEPHHWKEQGNLRQNYYLKQGKARTRSFNLT